MEPDDFWVIVLILGIPAAIITVLFMFARQGDVLAIVALAVLGTVAVLFLGVRLALAIGDRAREAELIRSRENTLATLAILDRMGRIQDGPQQHLSAPSWIAMLPAPDEEERAILHDPGQTPVARKIADRRLKSAKN